jgi:tetratricopeptide (TPR) repeat protein
MKKRSISLTTVLAVLVLAAAAHASASAAALAATARASAPAAVATARAATPAAASARAQAAASATATTQTTAPAAVAAARRALQAAVNSGQVDSLTKARARFQALSNAEPTSALLHYWTAVATWRTVPLIPPKDKAMAERMCQDGLDHCEAALKLDRSSGGLHAIKGALQGLMIGFRPVEMMTLGMAIEQEFGEARDNAPKDPRVWFLDGINTLHKPEPFGGGPAAAGEKLRKAVALYATDAPADSIAPDWGHDDALIWLGRAALTRKDTTTAEAMYVKALEVNPDNGWVRHVLLPRLRAARAGGAKP